MSYSLPAKSLGRDDTLLNLLSDNSKAVREFGSNNGRGPSICLRQSFMAAARAFKAIDAPTRGLIVPYGNQGKSVISDLCAASGPDKLFGLLRQTQQFTVSVYPNELQRLRERGAVREVQEGTDILYLDGRHYSQETGLTLTPSEEMEVLYAG